MDPVGGWIAGAITAELISALRDTIKKSIYCKKYCERLENTLADIIPILDEINQTGAELPQHRQKQLNEFYDKLKEGTELVRKCSKIRTYNVYQNIRYSKKILSLEKYVSSFFWRQGWAHILADMHHLKVDVENRFNSMGQQIYERTESLMHQPSITERMSQMQIDEDIPFWSSQIPELPECSVGLEISVNDLKKRLTCKDVSFLAIKGIGGSGKTTLAVALCSDPQVKEFFKTRIIFETVSHSPNLKGIIERMWSKIFQEGKPDFQSVEDAQRQFRQRLQQMKPQPTLVVLDDVWNKQHLETLLFRAEGYKTLITTRNTIVEPNLQYELQLLREADALSLFCYWAFKQKAIPETEEKDIVNQVIAKCRGLPLALKVVGSFLRDQRPAVWKDARNKLSRAESLSDCHKEGVLNCIERSITMLDKEVQECFLDLGSFPEDRKNSVASLLDLWVYVHDLEWDSAYTNLIELKVRNLVNLVNSPMDFGNAYGSTCELFTQHDVLRDLAIYLATKDVINRRKRLIMPQREESVPVKWTREANSPFSTEIVSLHTGMMSEQDWCQMSFPEAKALILNFSASEYFLPPFLQTMHKLKVLIIVNHSSKRAALKGLSVLSSLSQLKSVRLERVIVPPLQVYCQSWQKLEKLSLILCEGCGSMNELHSGMCLNFPRLIELTIDHCSNLEELPESICNMTSLQKLSVTNCHDLFKLPDDLGKLSSLEMLRLYACPSLEKLPYSICKLRQLKFLDISLCECLKEFPDEFGQLSSLKELDMRECSHLKQLPKSSGGLRSLKHVICDEKIGQRWSAIKASSIPHLNVEVAEEHFHLDWLED